MSRPDEGLIHAWLDGELEAAEAARVEALVRADPAWAAAAAEARGLIAASSRILGALDDVPAHVVPGAGRPQGITPKAQGRAPRHGAPWWTLRAAALLVVAAGSALVLSRSGSERVAALDELVQPASAPKEEARPSVAPAPVSPQATDLSATRGDGRRQIAAGTATGAAAGAAARKDAAPTSLADARDAKQAPIRAEAAPAAPPAAPTARPAPAARATAERETKAAPVAGAEQQARNEQSANRARVADSLMRKFASSPLALNQVVTTGVAEPTPRRALGMTVGSAVASGDAAKATFGKAVPAAEECYREARPVGGETLALIRVSRLSDSTATMVGVDEARRKAEQNFARTASSVFPVRGDTLFIGVVNGIPRVALRVSCPAP